MKRKGKRTVTLVMFLLAFVAGASVARAQMFLLRAALQSGSENLIKEQIRNLRKGV